MIMYVLLIMSSFDEVSSSVNGPVSFDMFSLDNPSFILQLSYFKFEK